MTEIPTQRFPTYLFDTTQQALWAEEVAGERAIPAEVVSAPPEAEDKCGMALRTLEKHASRLEAALGDEGIPFLRV